MGRPSRRDFLWTMGAVAAASGLRWTPDVVWQDDLVEDPGWAPGVEQNVNSTCLICPSRCGIRARVVDGQLVRIRGNPLHPLNRGGACPRGVVGTQLLYHPERLATPLARAGARGAGDWREITTEEALDQIAERIGSLRAEGRPEAVAMLSGYCEGSMRDLWTQFLQAVGSPNRVSDDYDDGLAAVMTLMQGIPRAPSYDLDRSSLVMSFGAPLFESWWSPLQAYVAFAEPSADDTNRPRFIQIDTRFSRTAARAQEWVGIQPGTHGALALGMAYVLIRDELFDTSFVDRHVSGFEDFMDAGGREREGYRSLVMRRYRSEEVAAVTGVPIERITSLARALAESPSPVVVCGSDVTHAPNGLLAAVAVHSLNVLLGRVNRPGGVLIPDPAPLHPLPPVVMDDTSSAGIGRSRIGERTTPFGSSHQALGFAEAVADNGDPVVDTLFLYYTNPFASSMRPEVWRRAFGRIPFIVSFSPFMDDSTHQADLILPDLLPYERWQDAPAPVSYPHPVWGVAHPIVDPPATTRSTGDVLLALASRLGGSVASSLPFADVEGLLRARARGLFEAQRGMLLGDAFEREHHRAMQARGWWLAEYSDFDDFWDGLVERGGWTDLFYDDTDPARRSLTASGRIELMPADLDDERDSLYANVSPDVVEPDPEYPLRLIPYRISTLASGTIGLQRWMAEQPTIFPEGHWVPWVEVAPETAHELGLADHTMVWVSSRHGRYLARLKEYHGTAPENVCAPYGLRHPDGTLANPLALLGGEADPLTGIPAWFSTFVRLERA